MVTLKLVNGRSYSCPPAFGGKVVMRGKTVTVSREHADVLLEESFFDASNNEHYYFDEVDPKDVEKEEQEAAEKTGGRRRAARPKPRRTKTSRTEKEDAPPVE